MSCNEWEHGTIKLPTAEAKRVRDAVKVAATKRAETLFEHTQKFWKGLTAKQKRDHNAFHTALEKYVESAIPKRRDFYDEDSDEDLWHVLQATWKYDPQDWKKGSAKRVLKSDMQRLLGKFTGANPNFDLGEASIRFQGRIVTWDVPENNHACDRAHEHPIAKVFFQTLDSVNWTRGSGGQIVGNNEYSRDSLVAGGGGNYVVRQFGPKSNVRRGITRRYSGW